MGAREGMSFPQRDSTCECGAHDHLLRNLPAAQCAQAGQHWGVGLTPETLGDTSTHDTCCIGRPWGTQPESAFISSTLWNGLYKTAATDGAHSCDPPPPRARSWWGTMGLWLEKAGFRRENTTSRWQAGRWLGRLWPFRRPARRGSKPAAPQAA